MSPRLIPWSLAATGFVAALTVFTWQGELHAPSQRIPLHTAVTHANGSLAEEHQAQTPAVTEEPVPAAHRLVLPLPPPTQPELDPNAQPVPDDAPTVDDLPARHGPSESRDDE
jgi:hypothetical protein